MTVPYYKGFPWSIYLLHEADVTVYVSREPQFMIPRIEGSVGVHHIFGLCTFHACLMAL